MKIITRGFIGSSSSVITRGYLDLFVPTFDRIYIYFSTIKRRGVDFSIASGMHDILLSARDSVISLVDRAMEISIVDRAVSATIKKSSTSFSVILKRFVNFIFRI